MTISNYNTQFVRESTQKGRNSNRDMKLGMTRKPSDRSRERNAPYMYMLNFQCRSN